MIKLVPRLYYTLPTYLYLRSVFIKKNNHNQLKGYESELQYRFNKARTGLRFLLSSLSDKPLNIGVQAYTCETVFRSIKQAGHNIVFLDIDQNLSLDKKSLASKANNIDAVIVTHTFGFPEDIASIKEIIGDKVIIEDCSHAFLSKHNDNYVGLMGHAAVFSSGVGKLPSIGSGGLCVINQAKAFPFIDKEIEQFSKPSLGSEIISFIKTVILSVITKPPFYKWVVFKLIKKENKKSIDTDSLNYSESFDYKWSSKMFFNNFRYFERLVDKRADKAAFFRSKLNSSFRTISYNNSNAIPNFFLMPIFVSNRNYFYNLLLNNGIECGKHFKDALKWATKYGYVNGECANTELIINNILVIPIHKIVDTNDLIKITNTLNSNVGEEK